MADKKNIMDLDNITFAQLIYEGINEKGKAYGHKLTPRDQSPEDKDLNRYVTDVEYTPLEYIRREGGLIDKMSEELANAIEKHEDAGLDGLAEDFYTWRRKFNRYTNKKYGKLD